MGKKKWTSHVEYHLIICVDTLLSRRERIMPKNNALSVGWAEWLPSKEDVEVGMGVLAGG